MYCCDCGSVGVQEERAAGASVTRLKRLFKRSGVKRIPEWCRLVYFDWAKDILLDYMHACKNAGQHTREMQGVQEELGSLKKLIRKWSPTPNMAAVRHAIRIDNLCVGVVLKCAV